uniref:WAP domain-containing protein n=1 Tax=Loxodonta africana TaxID=9785 RepID=G3TP73_LOXAF
MRPTSFLVLTVFLVFVTLVAGKRTQKDKVKAGICPVDNRICFQADLPRCERDKHCAGNKKCCFMDCGSRCVVPMKTQKKG